MISPIVFLLLVLQISMCCRASIVLNIRAGELQNAQGTAPIAAGTLIQLVNLGPNGVFDPVSIVDGANTGTGLWVSGDDTLVNVPFPLFRYSLSQVIDVPSLILGLYRFGTGLSRTFVST